MKIYDWAFQFCHNSVIMQKLIQTKVSVVPGHFQSNTKVITQSSACFWVFFISHFLVQAKNQQRVYLVLPIESFSDMKWDHKTFVTVSEFWKWEERHLQRFKIFHSPLFAFVSLWRSGSIYLHSVTRKQVTSRLKNTSALLPNHWSPASCASVSQEPLTSPLYKHGIYLGRVFNPFPTGIFTWLNGIQQRPSM